MRPTCRPRNTTQTPEIMLRIQELLRETKERRDWIDRQIAELEAQV